MADLALYEELKKEKKYLVCDKCKHNWELEAEAIHTQAVKNENKQEMMIQFFLCPKCNKIYVISIVDSKARALMSQLRKLEKFIIRGRKSGRDVSKEVSKHDQVRQSLMLYERMLKNKYEQYFYLRTEEVDR